MKVSIYASLLAQSSSYNHICRPRPPTNIDPLAPSHGEEPFRLTLREQYIAAATLRKTLQKTTTFIYFPGVSRRREDAYCENRTEKNYILTVKF